MYMRTVTMHVRPDEIAAFTRAYEKHIISAFAGVDGCLSAALMQSTREPAECTSLTFWRSDEDIRRYEQSGHYSKLVDTLSGYFLDSFDLQVRLTEDLKLNYATSHDPEVRKFELEDPNATETGEFILRMVSLKFRPGMVDAFRDHYENDIVPILRSLPGCRYAFLAAPSDNKSELISVTKWESETAADAYEHGGQFDRILESQRHFFATLADFKIGDDKDRRTRSATSDDIMVDKHKVLVGKRFSESPQ